MPFAVAKICADYLAALFIYNNHRLNCVAFFLPEIIFLLLIFAIFYLLLIAVPIFLDVRWAFLLGRFE